jgi:hypothetical protein
MQCSIECKAMQFIVYLSFLNACSCLCVGIGAVLGAAYYYYDDAADEGDTESNNDEDSSKEEDTTACTGPDPAAIQKRTNELIAVNDLFDFSLVYFLPTIKQKVKEVVDVTDTVKKLKELMKSDKCVSYVIPLYMSMAVDVAVFMF